MHHFSIAKRISIFLTLGIFLAGCAVGPRYQKPDLKLPATWQAQRPHEGNVTTLVNWWEQFNDPALIKLLHAAEKDSPSLAQAWARIKEARSALTSTQAAQLPALSGSASITRSSSGAGTGSSASPSATSPAAGTSSSNNLLSTAHTVALDASWEIDLFGSVKYATEAAQAQVEARIDNWHEARVSLAAEVATHYMNYRACQLQVAQYGHDLRSRQESARLSTHAAKAGFSSTADSALAQASAASASSTLIAQQAQCEITLKSLVALAGLPENDVQRLLSNSVAKLPAPATFSVTSLPVELISQRPDLAAAERSLAAASADIGSAEANRYPRLSLRGSISSVGVNVLGSTTHSTPWSFGPSLSLPLFDAGQRAANVRVAEARYEQALATYKQAVRNAVKEVEQALVQLNSLTLREQDVRTAAERYRQFYNATETHWRAGGVSLLTLEDARRSAITADMNLIAIQRDQIQNWIALYKALGGGWQETLATQSVNVPAGEGQKQ